MTRITTHQHVKQVNQPDSFEKGRLFEEYITTLFNQRHFKLEQWRKSERIAGGLTPFTHCFPDLELIFKGAKNYRFAIECKWKKKFSSENIIWIPENKIRIYKEFQHERGIPVFIAIGIGGEPFNPEKLFVTPLNYISMFPEIRESDLILYKRKPANRFFYDTVQYRLF